MRPFSPVEAAAAFAVVGSLAAVLVPSFLRNLNASRLEEPAAALRLVAGRAAVLAAAAPVGRAYPGSAPLTPAEVPRGVAQRDAVGTWDHPTWRLLGLGFQDPHRFAYAFDSENGPVRSRFRARAHGDLDGDGQQSTFEISGEVEEGALPVTHPEESYREVE